MATLDGVNLGTVVNETLTTDAGLSILPIPQANSTNTEFLGTDGQSSTISVQGFISVTSSTVAANVTTLRNLADPNPNTSTGVVYNGTSYTGQRVGVLSIVTSYNTDDANRLHYTIQMAEVK